MSSPLSLVHPESAPKGAAVCVAISLQGSNLSVVFDVQGVPANVNPELSRDSSQWGLWEWDVVELFLAPNPSNAAYYEFQVSPLGQFFELEIFEPRKRFNKEFRSGARFEATRRSNDSWQGRMSIPLEKLGWDGRAESVRGNAFAILSKTYWSKFSPKQEKPDFHLPQYFAALL